MRKLCLAFLFCLLSALPAKADREGIFIRIECNQDFGLLDIEKKSIFGAKIGDFFYQDFLTYEYDINKDGKSNTKIMILNGYNLQEPYKYHCELAPNQKFDITFEKEGAGHYINDVSFYVTITEDYLDPRTNQMTCKKLIDKLIIGAGGRVETIHIAAFDDNSGTNITLEQSKFIAYFMEPENEKPLSEETLTEEIKEMEEHLKREEEYIKKNGDSCEKYSCGTTLIREDDEESADAPATN